MTTLQADTVLIQDLSAAKAGSRTFDQRVLECLDVDQWTVIHIGCAGMTNAVTTDLAAAFNLICRQFPDFGIHMETAGAKEHMVGIGDGRCYVWLLDQLRVLEARDETRRPLPDDAKTRRGVHANAHFSAYGQGLALALCIAAIRAKHRSAYLGLGG